MVTRRGLSLLVGAGLLWAVGRILGVAELHVAAVAAAALVALGAVAVRLGSTSIAVRRSVGETRLLHGSSTDVLLELRNESRLPAPLLLVADHPARVLLAEEGDRAARFVVPGVGPGRTAALRYHLRATRRGRYAIGPVELRVRDPFGLVERVRRYRATDEVVVYPPVEELPEGIATGARHGATSSAQRRLFASGDEFHTMREYVTGDDLRRVHWPSTARRGKLMVRQHTEPWFATATVLCDARASAHAGAGSASSLERAVSTAASAVWHLADRRYRLRLVTETDERLPEVTDWHAALDRLAELRTSTAPSLIPALLQLERNAEGLLVAVVTPPAGRGALERDAEVAALLHAGRRFTTRAAVVVATGADDERAAELAHLLRAARWRAVHLPVGAGIAERWQALVNAPRAVRT